MSDHPHGFKKRSKNASPSKTQSKKKYLNYITDIGETLSDDELTKRIQRFEDEYSSSRPEYQDLVFTTTIDGKPREIAIPQKVARSIHAHCEFNGHPITANQKLQPNYVKSNVKEMAPNKVGKLKVSTVLYFNGVQQSLQLPNYFRLKSKSIQDELFNNKLMYRAVGNREDYPAIADLDNSQEVFDQMQKHLKRTTQHGQKTCGGSRLMESASDRKRLRTAMPTMLTYAPADVKEKATRTTKTTKNEEKEKRAVSWAENVTSDDTHNDRRQSPRLKKVKRSSDPTNARKRKLDYPPKEGNLDDESDSDPESSEDPDKEDDVDIFGVETLKMDWTEHPQYAQLYSRGMSYVADIGFKSPKAQQTTKTTLKTLAQKAKVNLPNLRNDAETAIVHAMTVNKIKITDTTSADLYADITKTES